MSISNRGTSRVFANLFFVGLINTAARQRIKEAMTIVTEHLEIMDNKVRSNGDSFNICCDEVRDISHPR